MNRKPIAKARSAAFEILLRVETSRAHSSALLEEAAGRLDDKDRRLCHEIVLGTLRRQILLDKLISQNAKRDASRLDPEIRITLRLGLYQLRFLDRTPDFAVVNDSVSLAAKAGKSSARGFVNAVLRGALRSGLDASFATAEEELLAELSHPKWLWERWRASFGKEEALELMRLNDRPRPGVFRLTRKFDDSGQAEKDRAMAIILERATPSPVVPGAFRIEEAAPEIRSLADQGLLYFQDEGSQLAALALETQGGDKVLDLCAAPGSKTSLIARSLDPHSGFLVAADNREARINVLKNSLKRQGVEWTNFVMLDAGETLPFRNAVFDKVLVDAPCTGTGTIASNPEIRYRIKPDDIAELAVKQLRILRNASKALKPGGRLIYSTCSLEVEENEEVIDRFLSESSDFVPVNSGIPVGDVGRFETTRLFPHRHGTEGFFAAAMTKSG